MFLSETSNEDANETQNATILINPYFIYNRTQNPYQMKNTNLDKIITQAAEGGKSEGFKEGHVKEILTTN